MLSLLWVGSIPQFNRYIILVLNVLPLLMWYIAEKMFAIQLCVFLANNNEVFAAAVEQNSPNSETKVRFVYLQLNSGNKKLTLSNLT